MRHSKWAGMFVAALMAVFLYTRIPESWVLRVPLGIDPFRARYLKTTRLSWERFKVTVGSSRYSLNIGIRPFRAAVVTDLRELRVHLCADRTKRIVFSHARVVLREDHGAVLVNLDDWKSSFGGLSGSFVLEGRESNGFRAGWPLIGSLVSGDLNGSLSEKRTVTEADIRGIINGMFLDLFVSDFTSAKLVKNKSYAFRIRYKDGEMGLYVNEKVFLKMKWASVR